MNFQASYTLHRWSPQYVLNRGAQHTDATHLITSARKSGTGMSRLRTWKSVSFRHKRVTINVYLSKTRSETIFQGDNLSTHSCQMKSQYEEIFILRYCSEHINILANYNTNNPHIVKNWWQKWLKSWQKLWNKLYVLPLVLKSAKVQCKSPISMYVNAISPI